jgi:hypothetical protein
MMENFLGSDNKARTMRHNVMSALLKSDPTMLVNEINVLFSALPRERFNMDERNKKFYRSKILILFFIPGLDPLAEKSGNLGEADFVVNYQERSWIIEVIIWPDEKGDKNLAFAAMKKIKKKNDAGFYRDIVRLALVIEDEKRSVTWLERDGGEKKYPDDKNG